jgi:5-methylcytosine-specific restriction endonuclease McrA
MTSLKSLRARASKIELQGVLGNKCSSCPAVVDLQFDCILPTGPGHKLMPWPERMRFYWRQHQLKNLQLLCPGCHNRKTAEQNRKHWRTYRALRSRLEMCISPTHFP